MYDQDSIKAVHVLCYNAKAKQCRTQTVHVQRPFCARAFCKLFFPNIKYIVSTTTAYNGTHTRNIFIAGFTIYM